MVAKSVDKPSNQTKCPVWSDTILLAVKTEMVFAVLATALMVGGCPKRQTTPRLVYVPAQAPAAATDAHKSTEAMVIEEPPPPSPPPQPAPAVPLPGPATPKPSVRQRPRSKTESSSAEQVAAPEASAEVPPLEPRATSEQQERLRVEISSLMSGTKQRIARLEQRGLSSGDRKTLEDAQRFLGDSERALGDGDLQRSQNLAHKAVLLVDAMEKNY